MARKRKKIEGEAAEPPMAAMIDVVFLLLIYFIITQKDVIPEAHLAVNLPTPSRSNTVLDDKPLLIELEALPPKGGYDRYQLKPPNMGRAILGRIKWGRDKDGKTVEIPHEDGQWALIKKKVAGYAKQGESITVQIKTAHLAKSRQLVKLLDLCKGNKLENLNLQAFKAAVN